MSTYRKGLIAARFAAVAPEPLLGDWADVLRRSGVPQQRPGRLGRFGANRGRRRLLVLAAVLVVVVALVAPALAIGDHILALIYGKSTPGDVQTPAWSPDGRKLAFVSRRDGNSEIYVMNADGSGQENLTQHPASDSHPSWSRDGRKLAFVSRRDGNSEIYVMNADGGGLRNLTRTPSDDLDPAWSPDGRVVAFVQMIQKKCAPSPPDTPCHYYETFLYVVNGDGSGLRRLTTQRAHLFNHSWSADGKTIRYGRDLVQADGSGQTRLPRNVASGGAWSPDGKRIAFAVVSRSFVKRTTGTEFGLWVMNADGSNPRRVARNAPQSDPAWSPDGRRIAFRGFDPQSIGSAGPSADLYVVNADGSGLRRLTRHAENVLRWFAWSPDGRTIAFLHNREVYIVKPDGSGERRLTQLKK